MLVWKAELLWIKNMSTVKKGTSCYQIREAHIPQNFIEIIQYDSDLHQVIKVVHRILNI